MLSSSETYVDWYRLIEKNSVACVADMIWYISVPSTPDSAQMRLQLAVWRMKISRSCVIWS